jgi:hypothetical protein
MSDVQFEGVLITLKDDAPFHLAHDMKYVYYSFSSV